MKEFENNILNIIKNNEGIEGFLFDMVDKSVILKTEEQKICVIKKVCEIRSSYFANNQDTKVQQLLATFNCQKSSLLPDKQELYNEIFDFLFIRYEQSKNSEEMNTLLLTDSLNTNNPSLLIEEKTSSLNFQHYLLQMVAIKDNGQDPVVCRTI